MKQFLNTSIAIFIAILLFGCTANAKDSSVSGAKIIKLIEKGRDVYFKDIVIDGDIDFSKTKIRSVESSGTYRTYINSSITFVNCTFNGKIIAYSVDENKAKNFTTFNKNLTFQGCTFKNTVLFTESSAQGIVNFSNSKFEQETNFQGFLFMFKDNYFTDTKYAKEAKFQRVVCYGNINFKSAEFSENVSFQKSKINNNLNFGAVKFSKYADFSSISVLGDVLFNYSKFEARSTFNNSLFNNRSDFNNIVFTDNVGFKNVQFRGLSRFNETKAEAEIDFAKCIFGCNAPDFESINKENLRIDDAFIKVPSKLNKE